MRLHSVSDDKGIFQSVSSVGYNMILTYHNSKRNEQSVV